MLDSRGLLENRFHLFDALGFDGVYQFLEKSLVVCVLLFQNLAHEQHRIGFLERTAVEQRIQVD
jgi:hypothetical protein